MSSPIAGPVRSAVAERPVTLARPSGAWTLRRSAVLVLALLCVVGGGAVGVGAAGGATSAAAPADASSLQEEREVEVTAALANGSGDEEPVVTTDAGSITVVANVTTSAAVDPGLVQQQWSYGDAIDESRVEVADRGERLTYDLAAADAGELLAFRVTAAGPGDENDTDVPAVDVRDANPEANAPNAVLTYFDDPETDAIERDAAEGTIDFSAFQSSDPAQNTSELTYEWQVSEDATGEIVGLSDLSGNGYDADAFARYHVADADTGESFAVRLIVSDDQGLVDTDTTTVRIHDDGSGYSPVEGGSAGRPAGEAAFDVAFVDAPETVAPGAEVDVAVRVENVGDADGTTAMGLALGGSDPQVRDVSVAAGESRRLDVGFAAPPVAGEYELTTFTQDVQRRHAFQVQQDDGDGAAPDGDGASGDGAGGSDASDQDAEAPQRAGTDAATGDDGPNAPAWAGLLGVVFLLSLASVGLRRVIG